MILFTLQLYFLLSASCPISSNIVCFFSLCLCVLRRCRTISESVLHIYLYFCRISICIAFQPSHYELAQLQSFASSNCVAGSLFLFQIIFFHLFFPHFASHDSDFYSSRYFFPFTNESCCRVAKTAAWKKELIKSWEWHEFKKITVQYNREVFSMAFFSISLSFNERREKRDKLWFVLFVSVHFFTLHLKMIWHLYFQCSIVGYVLSQNAIIFSATEFNEKNALCIVVFFFFFPFSFSFLSSAKEKNFRQNHERNMHIVLHCFINHSKFETMVAHKSLSVYL